MSMDRNAAVAVADCRIKDVRYSTKMNKKNVGLGLSICQHIAEAHEGIITYTSTPGEFTEFTVRLPIR